MNLSLQELIQILNEIAIQYIDNNQKENEDDDDSDDNVLTYNDFEKHLIEHFGINGKNQIVDQGKWIQYLLSRA